MKPSLKKNKKSCWWVTQWFLLAPPLNWWGKACTTWSYRGRCHCFCLRQVSLYSPGWPGTDCLYLMSAGFQAWAPGLTPVNSWLWSTDLRLFQVASRLYVTVFLNSRLSSVISETWLLISLRSGEKSNLKTDVPVMPSLSASYLLPWYSCTRVRSLS